MTSPQPRYLGDDPDHAERELAPLPPGWGALVVVYWCQYEGTLHELHGFHVWQPWPKVRVNGVDVPASWSAWHYPLRLGFHDVEVISPVPAQQRIEITSDNRPLLVYRASIKERRETMAPRKDEHGKRVPYGPLFENAETRNVTQHADFALGTRYG